MQNFSVSVAMCTYNGEAHVAEQLHSILNQTHPPDEIIIYDDGSTDCTVAEIRRVMETAEATTVQLHCNPVNLGYRQNFAQALLATSGDVVLFSDQDDIWMEAKIERILEVFHTQPETLLVYSDAILFDEDTGQRMLLSTSAKDFFREERCANEVLQSLYRTHNIRGCLMAFRAELKSAALPIPEGWGHDRWLTILAHALSSVSSVREPLVQHRRHENAVTRSFSKFSKLRRRHGSPGPHSHRVDWIRKPQRLIRRAIRGTGRREMPLDRYHALATRLKALEDNTCTSLAARHKLIDFIRRAESLSDTFEKRMEILRLPAVSRTKAATILLFKGFYHQNFAGMLSYFDDLAKS